MEKAPNAEAFIAQQKSFISSNPDCGTSHYNLGVALLGQGKIEEAEEALATAIECSPGLAEAYVQMGGICLKRGDTDGCLDWNQRAVRAKPGFSEGWGNIGFVLLQRGDIEGAPFVFSGSTTDEIRDQCLEFAATVDRLIVVGGDAASRPDAEADAEDQEDFRRFLDRVSPAELIRQLRQAQPEPGADESTAASAMNTPKI